MSTEEVCIIIGGVAALLGIFELAGRGIAAFIKHRTQLEDYQKYNDKRIEEDKKELSIMLTSFSKKLDDLNTKIDAHGQAIARLEEKVEQLSRK